MQEYHVTTRSHVFSMSQPLPYTGLAQTSLLAKNVAYYFGLATIVVDRTRVDDSKQYHSSSQTSHTIFEGWLPQHDERIASPRELFRYVAACEATNMTLGLQILPKEMLDTITANLDYASSLALSWTCKKLHSLISLSTYTLEDLLQIEQWPVYNDMSRYKDVKHQHHLIRPQAGFDYFACSFCLTIRSAIHFPDAQMRAHRGKFSPDACTRTDQRHRRFCITCAVGRHSVKPGQLVRFGGVPKSNNISHTAAGDGLVCTRCGNFGRVHPMYWGSRILRNMRCCGSCVTSTEEKSLDMVWMRTYDE